MVWRQHAAQSVTFHGTGTLFEGSFSSKRDPLMQGRQNASGFNRRRLFLDVGCGDDCKDTASCAGSGKVDQADLPRAEGLAQSGTQSSALGSSGPPASV